MNIFLIGDALTDFTTAMSSLFTFFITQMGNIASFFTTNLLGQIILAVILFSAIVSFVSFLLTKLHK